ncbi:MAG: hypothetical protein H7210_01790 [Pyrinomonadaceae bacterium]|nr:hypothetical protein [Phycisphaerales bacterium]
MPKGRDELLAELDEKTDAALDLLPDEARQQAEAMLLAPNLIDLILSDIGAMGVVGEQPLALTTYLIACSRLLLKPLAAIVQALSSSGKSFVISRIGQLIPLEAKVIATDITANALYYMPQGSLMHRFVQAGERRRGGDEDYANVTRALREMLEGGELYKMVTGKSADGKIESHLVRQSGPIAYIESTTNTSLFDEDANRCLLLGTDETSAQTQRVVLAQGNAGAADPFDTTFIVNRHHALQHMLKRVRVRVPFAPSIAKAIPTHLPQARRVMPQIMTMIQASALLHQRQRSNRELDHGDLINATAHDYVVARTLLMSPLGRSLGGALANAVTEFAMRLRKQYGGEVFSSTDALTHDAVLGSKSKVNSYLGALANVGAAECVEAAHGQKPASWKLLKDPPKGGCLWLPDVTQLEGV